RWSVVFVSCQPASGSAGSSGRTAVLTRRVWQVRASSLRRVRVWDAEVVVDAGLARRLIGQFPGLAAGSLRLLSEGWDRAAWLVNEQWVFGFPRRAVAVPGVEQEVRFLPQLAPLAPIPLP